MSADDPFRLAIIRGGVARAAGQPESSNPWGERSGYGLCWLHGYRRDPVSRETVSRSSRRPLSAERGRELQTLIAAGCTQRLAAEIIDRTHQAVRNWLSRQKKRAA